jgi:hypothetical protein
MTLATGAKATSSEPDEALLLNMGPVAVGETAEAEANSSLPPASPQQTIETHQIEKQLNIQGQSIVIQIQEGRESQSAPGRTAERHTQIRDTSLSLPIRRGRSGRSVRR